MYIVELKIPDNAKDTIINALCALGGYKAEIPNPDKPEETIPNISKGAFAKEQIVKMLKERVKGFIHRQEEELMNSQLQAKKDAIEAITIS